MYCSVVDYFNQTVEPLSVTQRFSENYQNGPFLSAVKDGELRLCPLAHPRLAFATLSLLAHRVVNDLVCVCVLFVVLHNTIHSKTSLQRTLYQTRYAPHNGKIVSNNIRIFDLSMTEKCLVPKDSVGDRFYRAHICFIGPITLQVYSLHGHIDAMRIYIYIYGNNIIMR